MEISRALQRGRAAAERRMRGRCRIERVGTPVPDGFGGVVTPVETVYESKHRSYYPGLTHESNFDSAGMAVAQTRVIVSVPFGTTFMNGDKVTIISDQDNPQLAGTVLRVASIDNQSQATAQRLLCEDNQSGVGNG